MFGHVWACLGRVLRRCVFGACLGLACSMLGACKRGVWSTRGNVRNGREKWPTSAAVDEVSLGRL
eukprot:4884778-Lingulodinium_polyedra.AAC.1